MATTDTRRGTRPAQGLRHTAARGVVINAGVTVAVSAVTLVRGFALAAFLTATDYGVWGTVLVALMLLLLFKQVGIGDKYVQQDEPDQELAFQRAFTLELLIAGAGMVVVAVAAPLIALAYGDARLFGATLSFAAALPAMALQLPIQVFYRSMQFGRSALLQAIEPVVMTAVSVGLAIAGAGYWALFGGLIAGAWAAAAAAVAVSPYPLRWRYDRSTLRRYWGFSWPLLLSAAGSVLMALAGLVAANIELGLAGAGVLTLAANISSFTQRVDFVVTGTLYPAICATADRLDVLRESFLKSNRLALMWAMPFGVGLTLFADDLVEFVLGPARWGDAVVLLQAYGVTAALGHLAFNYDAYFRARDETRPIAVVTVGSAAVFLVTAIPLLFADGLRGFAIGVAAQMVVSVVLRLVYLRRLFGDLGFLTHCVRAMLPVVPATAVVLALRAVDGTRSLGTAIAELVLFVAVSAAATWSVERPLLREVAGYLRPV